LSSNARRYMKSLTLTSEDRSLGMVAVEDGASGIIVKCDCISKEQ
jgi:hypothetical protein